MDKKKFLYMLQLFLEKLFLAGIILVILVLAGIYVHGSNNLAIVLTAIACVLTVFSYLLSRRLNRPLPTQKDLEELEKFKKSQEK